jgi:hypothetical protein
MIEPSLMLGVALLLMQVVAGSSPIGADREYVVAESKTYRLFNIFPFPVQVKVLGDPPSFPQVVNVPAGGLSIPIPYPDLSMRIQIRPANTSNWSKTLTVKWRSGNVSLPNF